MHGRCGPFFVSWAQVCRSSADNPGMNLWERIGPWKCEVPGFVRITRSQALILRAKNPEARILASLGRREGQTRARDGVRVVGISWLRFFARPEDLEAAGLPKGGAGWRKPRGA